MTTPEYLRNRADEYEKAGNDDAANALRNEASGMEAEASGEKEQSSPAEGDAAPL